MKEEFLHHIWQFQKFEKQGLKTTEGLDLNIIHPGITNHNAGPDFLNAKIQIDNVELYGHVEIHINSKDWKGHNHHSDESYNAVILHVVWNNGLVAKRRDDTNIPTLEIKNLTDIRLYDHYTAFLNSRQKIPCANQINKVPLIEIEKMKERALISRLQHKSEWIKEVLIKNNFDWEETSYQILGRNFGFKVNQDSFFDLTASLPLKIVRKHHDQLVQLESLLFGQAGFLEDLNSGQDYQKQLKDEYRFLKRKYGLINSINLSQWKFSKIRPSNFPSLRIAQFASVLNRIPNIFSLFIDGEIEEIKMKLKIKTSEYWRNHYDFGKSWKSKIQYLGKGSIENLIINTTVPLLFIYGDETNDDRYKEKALDALQKVASENNNIIRFWRSIGVPSKNAYDSQSVISLYNFYCKNKRCLNCSVGNKLIGFHPT
ncbi:MAG TPA: DUF2851 family protein [Cyclobacteriaceae bacterium]